MGKFVERVATAKMVLFYKCNQISNMDFNIDFADNDSFYKLLLDEIWDSDAWRNCNTKRIGYRQHNAWNNISHFNKKQWSLEELKVYLRSKQVNKLLENAMRMYEFNSMKDLTFIFSENELYESSICVVNQLVGKSKRLKQIGMIFNVCHCI